MAKENEPFVMPLGVAMALPDEGDANSYLTVVRDGRYWLVDCADSPVPRLLAGGLDPLAVEGIIITHFHPDHVYGLPAYALGLYMMAQERDHSWSGPLPICARPEVLGRVRDLLGLFEPQGWLETVPFEYREVAPEVGALVAETPRFRITAAPTCHSLPSLAVKFELQETGRTFVYSSDTGPCDALLELASGADFLIHEATGDSKGHTSPRQAGEIGAKAGVKRLGLMHYNTNEPAQEEAASEAGKAFGGSVELMRSLKKYPW